MSFGRKNLRLHFYKGYAVPLYLGKDDLPLLREIIQVYEKCLNKPLYKLDKDLILYIIGDDRLARGLIHTMKQFYKGIATIKHEDLRRRRLHVFRLVNRLYKGFVSSNNWNEFLQILRNMGVNDPTELWADEPQERSLVRVRKCTPTILLMTYNYEVMETIFTNSVKGQIRYLKGPYTKGTLTKVIIREAKRYGLLYETSLRGDELIVSIEGPISLFGHPTKYGRRIGFVLCKLLGYLYQCKSWSVWAWMHTSRGKLLKIMVASNKLKPSIQIPKNRPPSLYDSAVEERVIHALKAIGFNVIREPKPLILGDAIMVPDFEISRGDKTAFIELAGYWRREYAIKKAIKIMRAIKAGIPLIVLADEKLREFMPREAPIIYYRLRGKRPDIPYGKLIKEFQRIGKSISYNEISQLP